jgi:hypothetical protein
MPFDPKLIRPDDPPLTPNGELDLPSDLKALAEQLGDAAAYLAACYPPQHEIAQPVAAIPAWRRAVVAATVLASVVLGAAGVWLAVPGAGGVKKADIAAIPGDSVATIPHDSVPVVSTVSLADLSPPEMEALLDLIEREPNQIGSIAF